ARLKVGLKDRLQDELEGSLDHTIADRGDREDAGLAPILRDPHFPHWHRAVCPRKEFLAEFLDEVVHSLGLDRLECHPVYARGSVVSLGESVGFPEGLRLAHVGIQSPEAPGWFGLRLVVYPSSQVLQLDGRHFQRTPAFHVVEGFMCSRAPSLRGRYSASPLIRTQPPPSRLRPFSRSCRLCGLPVSSDFALGRGRLLQLLGMSLSPCCP